jgi:methylated-DNA-[protein]-cysteine S-methyltransferase
MANMELNSMNSAIKRDAARRRVPAGEVSRKSNDDVAEIAAVAFSTGLRWMAIAWSDEALEGVVFGHATRQQAEEALLRVHRLPRHTIRVVSNDDLDDAPTWVRQLVDDLKRFADGEPIDFSDVPIARSHLTPFGRRVITACRRIRWGQTSSYGELAAKCGASGAARAVGSVMAKNRFPLVVPCHRVLAASGRLGGYSAPGRLQTKRHLLAMEAKALPTFGS